MHEANNTDLEQAILQTRKLLASSSASRPNWIALVDQIAHGSQQVGSRSGYNLTLTDDMPLRLVGLDLEFFKRDQKNKFSIPCQIGLCYYDFKNSNSLPERRVDVLENTCIEQIESLDGVNWAISKEFVPFDKEEFESMDKISFETARNTVITTCDHVNVLFVGHGIFKDINDMGLYVGPNRTIDTANLYPDANNKPQKLRVLAHQMLNAKIQGGHHPPLIDAYVPIEIIFRQIAKGKTPGITDVVVPGNKKWRANITKKAGVIIGRGGHKVKHLREITNCEITVTNSDVTVRANNAEKAEQDAEHAKQQINVILQQDLQWSLQA